MHMQQQTDDRSRRSLLSSSGMSLKHVQQKFVAKCEAKCQGGITVARQLRKMFQQVDLDNDGLVNIREWATVVEVTNGAISSDEACALFEFWDTAGFSRDPSGAVSISEAIAACIAGASTPLNFGAVKNLHASLRSA